MKKIILKTTKPKEEKKGKGGGIFYTLLFITIVTVGTTSYVIRTRNNAVQKLSEIGQSREAAQVPAPVFVPAPDTSSTVNSNEETHLVKEGDWQSDDVIPVEEASAEVENAASEEVSQKVPEPVTSMIPPVNGQVIKPHSDTELSYSKTMEDWRLHKGVDISSPIGTTVIASANGEVLECYTDTSYGVTIVISHGNGLISKYSNLASSKMVEVGQQIKAGDAIGVIGDTAEFEVADQAHLHFEVILDGLNINPEEYFK